MILHQDGNFEYGLHTALIVFTYNKTRKPIYRITHECSHGQNIVALAEVSDKFALGHVAVVHNVVVAVAIPGVADAFAKLEKNNLEIKGHLWMCLICILKQHFHLNVENWFYLNGPEKWNRFDRQHFVRRNILSDALAVSQGQLPVANCRPGFYSKSEFGI